MSEITVKEHNGYYLANDGGERTYRSINGVVWDTPTGPVAPAYNDCLRFAFYAYLDSQRTDEPVRGKANDWVEVTRDRPQFSEAIMGKKYRVVERDGPDGIRVDIPPPNCITDGYYTIVDPPEPVRAKADDWVEVTHNNPDCSAAVVGVKYLVVKRSDCDNGVCLDMSEVDCLVSDGNYTIVDPPEPVVFTGDPSEWGEGLYRNAAGNLVLSNGLKWVFVGDSSSGVNIKTNGTLVSTYTLVCKNPNPADLIAAKWKGGA